MHRLLSIGRPLAANHVLLCVEDPEGVSRKLSVANYPGTIYARGNALDTIFPKGALLAIREPAIVTSDPVVRIDSPSDIHFIRPLDPILQGITWKNSSTASSSTFQPLEVWKDLGNKHFSAGQYVAAVFAYTNGLGSFGDTHLLRLNRAATYIKLEWFSPAFSDALHVIGTRNIPDELKFKARYRAAQAEYGLGRYTAALDRFKRCIRSGSSPDQSLKTWLSRCEDRIIESRGVYDWVQIFEDAQIPGNKIDVAEYVGPMKVVPMPRRGGGRGVVATKAIKAGELIVRRQPCRLSQSRVV